MKTIANYLFVAASSGFYSKKEWQSWADKQILKKDKVDDWIYSVSLAKDINELSMALGDGIIQENYYANNEHPPSDAVIGYYYMEYLAGGISIYELLTRSGDEADGGEATLECEEFYSILNEIDRNEKSIDDEEFIKNIRLMFEPFIKVAEQQLQKIKEY